MRRSLEQELRDLERTDPDVGRAAREYDRMRDEILSRREHRFFEHGRVTLVSADRSSRMAAFSASLPASLVQAAMPALLGAGIVDKYELMNPMSAWIPALGEDRFRPGLEPTAPDAVNQAVRTQVMEALSLFRSLAQVLVDPSDLIPMLPMGTYVTFRLRCSVDKLAVALEELERAAVAGVPEFRFALAGALAEALVGFES